MGWNWTTYVVYWYAMQKDMRSHTGVILLLGQWALMSMSLKLKTKHIKSSTTAELFAIDDDAMDFVERIQLYVEQ